MMGGDLLTVQEVGVVIGSCPATINMWYKWRRTHPDHELAKLLPDYEQQGGRQTRYWHKADIWKLIEFKQRIPKGRHGILGEVTQAYVKKEKKNVD